MPISVSCNPRIRIIAFCFLVALQAYPQSDGSNPIRTGPAAGPRQMPCWQQVGIAKNVIEQRRDIEQSTRAQVESVCADSSLTPQQKHQKIKELRQQARQQIDAIITPQQQEELKACNVQRSGNRPGAPRRLASGGSGPCGESASSPPAPQGGHPATAPQQP